MLGWSSVALGLAFDNPTKRLVDILEDLDPKISVSPFADPLNQLQDEANSAKELFLQGKITFRQFVGSVLHQAVGSPILNLTSQAREDGASANDLLINLEANHVPICRAEVRAKLQHDGALVLVGNIASMDSLNLALSDDWPDPSVALQVTAGYMKAQNIGANHPVLQSAERCYQRVESDLMPALHVVVKAGPLAYQAWVGKNRIFDFENLFFDLDKSAKITTYPENVKKDGVKEFTLTLRPTESLDNEFFTTTMGNSGISRAHSSSYTFNYEPSDPRFAEASAFAHATWHYEYFQKLGFVWWSVKPLVLSLHALIGETKNNALYQPPSSATQGTPTIFIGDGDGVVLTNLAIDADVVSHEFGHHVIYKTLKSTSGESLILHEGLADYFALAHFDDTCLGESICVAGGGGCYLPDRCLRTSDNSIKVGDTTYQSLTSHLRGQVVSGLLNDLKNDIGNDATAQIVYDAMSYFVATSGFRDFVMSLMLADRDINKGTNTCRIYDTAIARGFGPSIKGVDCTNPNALVAPVTETATSSDSSTGTSSSKTKKKDIWGCGVLGDDAASSNGSLATLGFPPLLLLVIALILRRRTKN